MTSIPASAMKCVWSSIFNFPGFPLSEKLPMILIAVFSGLSLYPPENLLYLMIPVFLLYPEIHYRFKYFPFSRYFRKEPEILADAPYRLEPGQPLPVLVMIKDSDRFPIHITRVEILVRHARDQVQEEYGMGEAISRPFWSRIFEINLPAAFRGKHALVDVTIHAEAKGKKVVVRNDNFTGLSQQSLRVFCAEVPLPLPPGWIAGDIHYHSHYTSDQVEYGASLEDTRIMARSAGLKFFAVTDHSYDLDDAWDNYLTRDPFLPKWKDQINAIDRLNANPDGCVLLQGEEVTCANADGRNIHCLVLNNREYLPGSGDSAEQWLKTRSELLLTDVSRRTASEALIIAAHPAEEVPILQRWLIRRGNWTDADWNQPFLHGFQILNGADNRSFRNALARWKELLLQGRRVCIYAGNDAHGNFNRFRQVRLPMITLHERLDYQLFGWAKTLVRLDDRPLNPENIFHAIRNGAVMISTGPSVEIQLQNPDSNQYSIGNIAPPGNYSAIINAQSTAEFGMITKLQLIQGRVGSSEMTVADNANTALGYKKSFSLKLNLPANAYVRAVLETDKNHLCVTNPIWIDGALH